MSEEQQNGRLEPWYSYTHWFPMASPHVLKPSPEPVPRMQPAMMMFSSKYWARRGLSLDSAMFHQQQQRHTGGQMVRIFILLPQPRHVLTVIKVLSVPFGFTVLIVSLWTVKVIHFPMNSCQRFCHCANKCNSGEFFWEHKTEKKQLLYCTASSSSSSSPTGLCATAE